MTRQQWQNIFCDDGLITLIMGVAVIAIVIGLLIGFEVARSICLSL